MIDRPCQHFGSGEDTATRSTSVEDGGEGLARAVVARREGGGEGGARASSARSTASASLQLAFRHERAVARVVGVLGLMNRPATTSLALEQ